MISAVMPAPSDIRPATLTITLREPRLGLRICTNRHRDSDCDRETQQASVSDHSKVSQPCFRRPNHAAVASFAMALSATFFLSRTNHHDGGGGAS
jgi:hypothetical protein